MTPANAPGFGDTATWPACAGHPNDPRTDGDDFDPADAAELIPLAWLESLQDASTADDETPRVLGLVPNRGGALADQMHARILDSRDGLWLLVLALNHPEWAEPALRAARDLCMNTPSWANWLQHCQDKHDAQVKAWADEARDALREAA